MTQNKEMALRMRSGFGNRNIPYNWEMTHGMRRGFGNRNTHHNWEMTQGMRNSFGSRNMPQNPEIKQGFQGHQLSVTNQSLIILQIIGRSKLQMWGRTDC